VLQELARRCDTLIRLVEKENEEYEAKPGKKAAAVGAASKGAAAASRGGDGARPACPCLPSPHVFKGRGSFYKTSTSL